MQLEMFLPAMHCDECGKATYDPVWVVRSVGRSTVQFAFCCQLHADAFYKKRQYAIRRGDGYVPEL